MPAEILLPLGAVKAALLVGIALLVVRSAGRISAAMRHAIVVTALGGAVLLLPLSAALPTFTPLPEVREALAVSPGRARWADEAMLLLLVRGDAKSAPPVPSTLRARAESRRAWILGVWLAGTLVVLARIAADLAAARRARSRARPLAPLAAGVPLLHSSTIASPVVVGVFRPAILLPEAPRLETKALRAVIEHELAHIERRDCLTQLLVRIACAIYWFNPLVWCAARRIALERERACDDRVVSQGVDPFVYSELLIDMARAHARAANRLHALPSMAPAAQLESRIVRILAAAPARHRVSRRCGAALALSAACLVAPLAALGMHDRPPPGADADPFFDPRSERVAGVREPVDTAQPGDPATVDGRLIAKLQAAAAREPRDASDLVPDRARWALSLRADGRVVEPLLEALQQPDWQVQGYAAWALGLSGDPRAIDPLLPLLDSPVWRLRAMAAFALRAIGGPRPEPALERALDDPAWQVRLQAVSYFGEQGDSRLRERLEILRFDPHIAVRLAAGEALETLP